MRNSVEPHPYDQHPFIRPLYNASNAHQWKSSSCLIYTNLLSLRVNSWTLRLGSTKKVSVLSAGSPAKQKATDRSKLKWNYMTLASRIKTFLVN